MNRETMNNYRKIFIYLIIYIAISAVIINFNLNRRYLIFNVGLSFIPYIISSFCVSNKNKGLLCTIGMIVTLAFYPNAIYMFTDFIHIRTSQYYSFNAGEVTYVMDYVNWIKLGCDVTMITLSLILSFESFINMLKVLRCYQYKFASFVLLVLLSGVTGIAVYIGRFLRFNSWDILKIYDIVKGIMDSATMNDYYLIGTFAVIHFIIIAIFANMKSN